MLKSRQSIVLAVMFAAPTCAPAQEQVSEFITPYMLSMPQNTSHEHQAPEVPSGHGFDWIVSIGHKGRSHALGGHFCGGSVIAPRWVLTAAHCVHGRNGRRLATSDIQIRTGYELHMGGRIYEVDSIFAHAQYTVTPFKSTIHDIALIKTTEDIVRHGDVQMLRPIRADEIQNNVIVLGWGKPRKHLNYISERLRFLYLTRVENQRCNDTYYSGLIDDKMICALGEGTDACQGDSGGPLLAFFNNTGNDAANDPEFVLYGIVSWGEQCGESQKPGIYASVPGYLDWIEETIKKN